MNRKPEIIMSIIAIIITIGSGFLVAGFFSLFGNEELLNEMNSPEIQQEMQVSEEEYAMVVETVPLMGSLGVGYVVILTLLVLVLSIIGTVVIRGNRKPKLGGGLLLAAGVISLLGTIFIFFLSGILFVIAGIMCFARKPKAPVNQTYSEDVRPL